MTTVNLSPLFNGQSIFDNNGNLLAGGSIYTYQAGSSTPLATYTTNSGNIANTNPLTVNAYGRLDNELWLQYGYAYKFVVQDASSNTIATYDNIAGILTQAPTTSASVPSGCILIWSGAIGSIPSGFVICDGSNGTPDLRSVMIMGAGSAYSVGQTGGTADAVVVNHTHTYSGTTSGQSNTHTHNVSLPNASGGGFAAGADFQFNVSTTNINNQDHNHTFGGTTANASSGVSGTGQNIPPYYALAYIMKT